MFASVDLARRIDRAEAGLSIEIARVTEQKRPDARVYVKQVSGGAAVFAGLLSPVNKLIGAGFADLPLADEMDRIEHAFVERTARLQAEVSTLADPAFHTMLCKRGYVLQGFENVLGRTLSGVAADTRAVADAGPSIQSIAAGEVPAWASMLVDAFAMPDTQGVAGDQIPPRDVIEQVMGDMLAMQSLHRYVIRDGAQMVSGASLRIDDGVAQFTGSATIAGYRRRGFQTALVNARLADAKRLGCDIAVVTTAPGSKSQENLQKQGFSLLYSRALLVFNDS